MEDIEITFKTLLVVASGIVTLGGAVAVFSRWLTPFKDLKQKVENKANKADLEALKREFDSKTKELEQLRSYQNIDHDRLKDLEKGNEVICKCMLALTDHELTGNSIDKLRAAKEEMQNYLIER